MTRRKVIGASLFFTLFGAMAILPPLIFVFRFDALIAGFPVESVFLFGLWLLLIVGAAWFGVVLPHDEPSEPSGDGQP